MDEAESMIGISDDENNSATNNEDGEDSGSALAQTDEIDRESHNGVTSDLIGTALEDGVDDEDEDDDEDDAMNPINAARALRELVGVVGGGLVALEGTQNHQGQGSLCQQQQQTVPTRYLQVEGFDGRRNDVVYCSPLRSTTLQTSKTENANNHEESSSSTESSAMPAESPIQIGTHSSQKSGGGESKDGEGKPKVMLFFGGDIQDFPEMMEQHRDHRNYVQFNLEATALQLQKQFPDHHIAVVRPSRIQMLTFSCYDNFVHCNHTGAPEHVITHHSLHHLELLLQNLSRRITNTISKTPIKGEKDDVDSGEDGLNNENQLNSLKDCGGSKDGKSSCNNSNNDDDSTVSSTTIDESSTAGAGEAPSVMSEVGGRQRNSSSNSTNGSNSSKVNSKVKPIAKNIRLDRAEIGLVGFSKGCVVLNQLLYEFHYLKTLTPDDLSMDDFLHCIKDMFWLDGGHNGGKNTWITSRSLLETLTRLGVRIHVHLTPYQLLDDRRPWIRKEEKLFSELLKKFSAPIVRQIHFENEPASLQQHLRIIADFNMRPPQQQQPRLLQSQGEEEIDGGGESVVGAVENHKSVVNVMREDGETLNHENNMEH